MNRRDFIRKVGCGAMGSTTLMSTLTSLAAVNGAMSGTASGLDIDNDYKALVCVLFSGGIDSYNILIPTGTTVGGDNGYNEYKTVRSDIAIPNGATDPAILALNNPQCGGFRGQACNYGQYGVHPKMVGVQNLFNTGKLAFMSNIGTLVEPILNKAEHNSGLKKLPLGLYSHSDQIMQWQTSVPQSRDALGVGGRIADLLYAANSNDDVSMNISLGGKNSFQRGRNISEYSIGNNVDPSNVGITALPSWWSNSGLMTDLRNNAIDSLVSTTYANLLHKTYSSATKNSLESFELFKSALKYTRDLNVTFDADYLSKDLQAVAKVMSVSKEMGAKRQIFFVNYGGWDMHDNLIGGLNTRLEVVSKALSNFYQATVNLGIANKVTTFTISDFARTITSNGLGSDHAWGGNTMVMGGAVNGGKIFGRYPKMDVGNSNQQNVSFRGNFIPAVSTDEMYAELALWYGVSPYDLCYVLPNLSNFYAYSPSNYPIGFMNFAGTTISTDDKPQGCLTY